MMASNINRFMPQSLATAKSPPVFLFARETPRSIQLTYAFVAAGLQVHSNEEIRDEMLRALRELWTSAVYEQQAARLQKFWNSMDAGAEPDLTEKAAVEELSARVTQDWPRLKLMATDNLRFQEDAPKVALALMLRGWEGVPVTFAREAGQVPLATLDELERWLRRKRQAGKAAFVELLAEALRRSRPRSPTEGDFQ